MRNRQQTVQILQKNAAQCEMNVKEYAEHSAKEDPTFYQFLFPDENVGDYGVKMTKGQQQEADEFIASL